MIAKEDFIDICIPIEKFCQQRTKLEIIMLMNSLIKNTETKQKVIEHHLKYCRIQDSHAKN